MTVRPNLRIDSDRLWQSWRQLAEIGATPGCGGNGQSLTPEKARGRAVHMRSGLAPCCAVAVG